MLVNMVNEIKPSFDGDIQILIKGETWSRLDGREGENGAEKDEGMRSRGEGGGVWAQPRIIIVPAAANQMCGMVYTLQSLDTCIASAEQEHCERTQ